MKLPESFIRLVGKYGVKQEDILFAAEGDLDEDYRFTDTVVAITKEKLLFASYPYTGRKEMKLGGYAAWQFENVKKEAAKLEEPALMIYDLKDIEEAKVLRQISIGVFMIKIKDTDKKLCQFSNTRMESFMRLSRLIEKVTKGEEIKPEDKDIKRGRECCPKCGMIYPDQERKVCPKCMDKRSLVLRVASYFKPYKIQLVVIVLCFLGTAVLNLVWPYLSGTILYDRVLAKDETVLELMGLPEGRFVTALVFLVIAMLVSKLLIQLLGVLHGNITARISPKVVAKLKSQVFDSMSKLSISFFTKRQTGGLMTRVLDDADGVLEFFIDGVPYLFVNIATIIATVIIMVKLNLLLSVITVIFVPILFIISYKMVPYLWHFYGKRHRANKRLNSQLHDNLTGARVVRAFGQEEQEKTRFGKSNSRVMKSELDLTKFDISFVSIYSTVESLMSFLVWAVGGALLISRGDIEVGLLITFAGYVGQLQGPLEVMSRIFRWYTECMNSVQRIFEIIDAVPEVKETENPYRPERIKGEIELKNVTFGYEPNKPILKDISFHVDAGEVFGIVGRSGAGKSTLVNLISRLYDPEEGEILVDGLNVKEYGFKELRRNIAMVSQETYIFMGTVAENIAFAKPNATRAEIISAAIQANAHDFICKMSEGYDTVIGASEKSLSGGEKQRISIARAILADPQILILDEATSAVDTETELAIQKALEKLEKGRTVLSIAHRLSTLRNATHLIVIDEGKVAESGTHEELLELKGTYYKLSELQTKALAMRGIE